MNFKNPIFSVSFRYGALATSLSLVLFSVLYHFGRSPFIIPAFLDYRLLLFPIVLVFGIRDYKENWNNGLLHFWQGFSIGMLIILMVGITMAIFILFLGKVADPNLTVHYIHTTIQNIMKARENIVSQYGEAVYNKSLVLVSNTTLADLALDYFIKGLPLGIILTILISLVLRKSDSGII